MHIAHYQHPPPHAVPRLPPYGHAPPSRPYHPPPPVGYHHYHPHAPPPTGHAGYAGGYHAPPRPHYEMPPPHAQGSPADFAQEKPEAYQAFVRMSVETSPDGTDVCLSDNLCQDRHVSDFLKCLGCWLSRHMGDPRMTGRPWRLRSLDLSRNGLADASVVSVMETLKRLDVRVEKLRVAGNKMESGGLASVVDYVWSCQEALLELDLSDNRISADPTADPGSGSDCVSALLRCFYNHASYPRAVRGSDGAMKVVPLHLRLGGNRVSHPKTLLREIEEKGGRQHVRVCPDLQPYAPGSQEFLSIHVPDFTRQRRHGDKDGDAEASRRADEGRARAGSRSRDARRRRRRKSSEGADEKRTRRRNSGKAVLKASAAVAAAQPERWRPARSSSSNGSPAREEKSKKGPDEHVQATPDKVDAVKAEDGKTSNSGGEKGITDKPAIASATVAKGADGAVESPPAGSIPENMQHALQREVAERLARIGGLPSEDTTREMLAEFVVCMVVARKGPREVEKELETFLGAEARAVADWLEAHLQTISSRAGEGPPHGFQ